MCSASERPGSAENDHQATRKNRVFHGLVQYEFWLAIIFVGVSILWTGFLPWAVLGLGILSVARWVDRGRWSVRTPVDGLVIVLAIMACLSLWITPLPEVTLPQVNRLLTGIALFYVMVNWMDRSERIVLGNLGAASLAPALAFLALFSVEWPAGKLPLIPISLYESFPRLIQDVIHPNVLAGNLAVVLPFVLALFLFPWNRTKKAWRDVLVRLLLGGLIVSIFLVLFLTQSRASWMAILLAVAVLVILRFRRGWLLVLLAGAGGLVSVYYFVDVDWLARWLRSSYYTGDLASRMNLWARGIFMLQDFFFTGIGMGTFAHTTDELYPLRAESPPHVHNLFLQVGVDLGMPGLLAWLGIFILVCWAGWRLYCYPTVDNPWVRSLGAGILSSQAALLVNGLFDSVTWGMIRPAPMIWGLWGLCLGAYLLICRTQAKGA